MKKKLVASIVLSFAIGSLFGAASIRRPIPNAPPELPPARSPWSLKDVMGLVGSMGIRALSGHLHDLPFVVMETDKTFALSLPAGQGRVHFVLLPKKDIRDPGQISAEDQPYLTDIFLTARRLVEKENLKDYRIYTNGRGLQSVAYLHFHLVGKRSSAA